MLAIHGASGIRYITYRQRRPGASQAAARPRKNAYSTVKQKEKVSAFTDTFSFCLTGNYLSSQAASSQVLSAYVGLTAVFEMGTGGTPQLSSPDCLAEFAFACSLKTPHRRKIELFEK